MTELISANEFSKAFKIEDVELFVAKAVDEEAGKHFIVCSIKEIPEVNAANVQHPFVYDTAEARDKAFDLFDVDVATGFFNDLLNFIKTENEKIAQDENKN